MAIEEVAPASCTLWHFYERLGEELTSKSCEDLINSIGRHGQRQPALGRRVKGATGQEIELIYGGRRLFAAKALGINLLVDIRELSDRAGIVEMEIENRIRTDISPYERGMSYRRWLNARLFANQSEMAKELGVSEARVSRLLRYAELPAAVIAAFDSVSSIREEWAVALARQCRAPDKRPAVIRRARLMSEAAQRHPPHIIYRRLISQDGSGLPKQVRDEVVTNAAGKAIYRISIHSKTVHFIVPRDGLSPLLVRELKRKLSSTLEQAIDQALRNHALPTIRKRNSNVETNVPCAGP
jgi:ParB family transcriptional regulator, chromosome partitioning protein